MATIRLRRYLVLYGLGFMFSREHVLDGGLISYGVDLRWCYRRGAYFVDKILRGTPPGELPVEFPTKMMLSSTSEWTARREGTGCWWRGRKACICGSLRRQPSICVGLLQQPCLEVGILGFQVGRAWTLPPEFNDRSCRCPL